MDDRVPDLMARPDVDQVDLRAVEVQLVARVEQGRRQDELDAVEVIVLPQLLPRGRDAGVERLEDQAREEALDAVQ